MAGQFIEVDPEVGDRISLNVGQSAKELGLTIEYILWYQGDPVWFVQEKEERAGGLMLRRVQIIPYWLDGGGKKLYFIPQIFFFPEGKNIMRTLRRVDPRNIRSMPLSESANSANFTAFYRNVSDAWRTAKEYPLDSLNYIIPRVEF